MAAAAAGAVASASTQAETKSGTRVTVCPHYKSGTAVLWMGTDVPRTFAGADSPKLPYGRLQNALWDIGAHLAKVNNKGRFVVSLCAFSEGHNSIDTFGQFLQGGFTDKADGCAKMTVSSVDRCTGCTPNANDKAMKCPKGHVMFNPVKKGYHAKATCDGCMDHIDGRHPYLTCRGCYDLCAACVVVRMSGPPPT
jgi:hypothetical protein